ncbi:M24 family metallopeptidase [Granulosicoccus antarcticus]|uniref:Methionine aminopeptidase 1 n=1 Tax=Granulosicoccus antarcticus IMCC3135 TaxID=1192854 RepID=A0A2Z2NU27_9GAMM|nr:M24 family metallopeptidase [Granulosicoccus antarcticus]ASJ70614.1 Methionine aminopeptidase 1 [Granulosicoccus antarcticus IMCC3135]
MKNEDEIARMTVAAQVAAVGQQTARLLSVAGADELAVFGAVRSKMEQCAGIRIAFAGELLTGVERSSRLGISIATREIHDGDPVICDLAPRVNGYWGDSCSAFVVGGAPEKDYERMYKAAHETLRLAVAELRPGLRVCGFDASLREFMKGQGYAYLVG